MSQLSIRKVLFVATALLCFPAFLLLAPFAIAAALLVVSFNVLRASGWNLRTARKLSAAILDHILFSIQHTPLMVRVLLFYLLRAEGQGARLNIPYQAIAREQRRLRQQRRAEAGAAAAAGGTRASPTLLNTSNSSSNSSFASHSGGGGSDSRAEPPRLPGDCSLDVYPPLPSAAATTAAAAAAARQQQPPMRRRPVIVFVYGGAWGSGAKWMYARLAAALRDACGACVVVPDYPLYPNGTVATMVAALEQCLAWIDGNIALFGGDRRRVFIVGHSAGAHLASLLLLRQRLPSNGEALAPEMRVRGDHRPPVGLLSLTPRSWAKQRRAAPKHESDNENDDSGGGDAARARPPVRAAILFGGVFDLPRHFQWEQRRGVAEVSTMRGAVDGLWLAHSPLRLLQQQGESSTFAEIDGGASAASAPAFHLVHDPADATVSVQQSLALREALLARGFACPPVQQLSVGHAAAVLEPQRAHNSPGAPPHPTIATIAAIVSAEC